MVDEFKVPVSPEWDEICDELKQEEGGITDKDIDDCRAQLMEPLRPVYDGMSEKRRKMLAVLAKRSKNEIIEIGQLSGEPEAFPDIREDLNFILQGREK